MLRSQFLKYQLKGYSRIKMLGLEDHFRNRTNHTFVGSSPSTGDKLRASFLFVAESIQRPMPGPGSSFLPQAVGCAFSQSTPRTIFIGRPCRPCWRR